MKIICERMKKLRQDNNLSVSELASTLGISQPTLSNYEAGKRMPDTKLILEYSNLFFCTTDYLYGKENSKERSEENVFNAEMKDLVAALSTIKPQTKTKLIHSINKLCKSLAFIKNISDDDQLEESVDLLEEFISNYDELHDRLAEYPHYNFNELSNSTIMEHDHSVIESAMTFVDLPKRIMSYSIKRMRKKASDAN